MTLVLDRHTSATHRLPDVRGWIEDAARILFKAWRDRRQAAILRDLDPTTRADIGYSCDYIRDD